MPTERKVKIVNELKEKLQKAQSVILTSYAGLSVPDLEQLRQKLRQTNAELKVIKNTLLKVALRDSRYQLPETSNQKPAPSDQLAGPTALVISRGDEFEPLKALYDFAAENEALKVKGGFLGGTWTDGGTLARIAKLPGKDELRAKTTAMLQSPVVRLVNVLQANQRKIAIALAQIAKTKTKAG